MADEMTRQEIVNFIQTRIDVAFNAMKESILELDDRDLQLDLLEGMTGLMEIRKSFSNDDDA